MDFEKLYLTYKDDVYRFLYKLCHYQADLADDLTQETFIKVYQMIDQFREESQFKTWIFSLPEPMKSVFLARIYTEDSYEKIAADVGISLSSAKVLVHRARKILKKRLQEDYGYDL